MSAGPDDSCFLDECSTEARTGGLCNKHYQRRLKHGDPRVALTRRRPPATLENIRAECSISAQGCWEWGGARSGGYGIRGREGRVHRIAYGLSHGEIPKGLLVRHKCDNPPCCNPEHLELGTHVQNARDAIERGRWPIRPRGEGAPGAKLTEREVREIRGSSGVKQRDLARRYGVSQRLIFNIIHNKARRQDG